MFYAKVAGILYNLPLIKRPLRIPCPDNQQKNIAILSHEIKLTPKLVKTHGVSRLWLTWLFYVS